MSDFKELKLNPHIQSALESKGYLQPTPIQQQAIPHLLQGRDLLGIAQTGTGKTAAFSLPILDKLAQSNQKVRANNMRALILTPTRELASQIGDNIKLYGAGLGLRHLVLFGGVNIKNHIREMKKGFDIVIATPGRLLDLKSQGHVRMSQIEVFVLDEADRMLDMGFIHDVRKVVSALPEKRQNLLFSATMPDDISALAESLLNNPVKVEVTPQATTVEKIDQRINLVAKENKPALLKAILQKDDVKRMLVFSKTKYGANRIANALEKDNIGASVIHSNKSQSFREKALAAFRTGEVKVLVATDIAARGIDIPNITHVINYDIPHDPASYVHRIGRTARAGKKGIAISFCDPSERDLLKVVEKTIKYKIPIDEKHPLHGVKVKPRTQPVSQKNTSKQKKGLEEKSYFAKNRRRSKSAFPEDGLKTGAKAKKQHHRPKRPKFGRKS